MQKKYLTILLISISSLCFGQTSLEIKQARNAVQAYLMKKLNNPGSYKSVSWGKVDKIFIDFEDSMKAKEIDEILETFKNGKDPLFDKLMDAKLHSKGDFNTDSTYNYYANLEKRVLSETDSLTRLRSILKQNYVPKFNGYSIDHVFRARNKFNALILQNYIFALNKKFKVTSSNDIDEIRRERDDLQRRIDELTGGNN